MKDKIELAKSFALGIVIMLIALLAIEALSVIAPEIYGDAKTTISQWGVLGVFIGVFIGSTVLPFPTDVFFATAVNLSENFGNKLTIVGVAIIASFIGALINYFLAFYFREKFVHSVVSEKQLKEAKDWFDKYGPFPILFFGIIPASPIFDPITFIAGLTGMDAKEFVLYSFASRVLHFGLIAVLAAQVVF